jgi:hypothetical protein
MRFSLKQTSARAFDISLPDQEGRARQLGFEHITELGGAVEIAPHAILLQEAAARSLQLTAAEWRTPSGLITIGAPVAVMELFVDGRIPRGDARSLPLDGRVTVKRLHTDSLVLEGFIPRLACGVRVERLDVAQHAPAGTAALESLALSELETTLGSFLVRLAEASIGNVQARWPVAGAAGADTPAGAGEPGQDSGLEVTAASITAAGLDVRSRAIEIAADHVAVQEAAIRGRTFSLAAVSVGKLSLELDLAALAAREREESADAAAEAPPAKPSIRSLIDWRFLDRVDGQIDVDVTVDVHLPVIRRRRATHCFRVPIEKGIFNYRQLESGLASLENAVIDFDLKGHKLVIERDLPIIRMRKNLVEWRLDDEEMALARQRKVKLRTLPRFEITPGNGKNSDVKLHGLAIHPINIDLSVSPALPSAALSTVTPTATDAEAAAATGEDAAARTAGEVRADAAPAEQAPPSAHEYRGILPELSLRRLMVTGSIDYPDAEGSLAIKVKQLATALRGLPLGNVVVDVGAVRVDSIDPIKIVFDGLVPRAISLTINGLALERVTVTRVAADAASAEVAETTATADRESEPAHDAPEGPQPEPGGDAPSES